MNWILAVRLVCGPGGDGRGDAVNRHIRLRGHGAPVRDHRHRHRRHAGRRHVQRRSLCADMGNGLRRRGSRREGRGPCGFAQGCRRRLRLHLALRDHRAGAAGHEFHDPDRIRKSRLADHAQQSRRDPCHGRARQGRLSAGPGRRVPRRQRHLLRASRVADRHLARRAGDGARRGRGHHAGLRAHAGRRPREVLSPTRPSSGITGPCCSAASARARGS